MNVNERIERLECEIGPLKDRLHDLETDRPYYKVVYICGNCKHAAYQVIPNGEVAIEYLADKVCHNCGFTLANGKVDCSA